MRCQLLASLTDRHERHIPDNRHVLTQSGETSASLSILLREACAHSTQQSKLIQHRQTKS